jgi:hypothetical protein
MITDTEIFESDVMADFKTIIRHALDRGLTIHPVKPRNKEPWLNNWPKKASREPGVIQEWMTRFPTSNYGVAASEEFCILESDNVGELQSRLSKQLPTTYTVQARPNRPHLYFRQTEKSRTAGNMDCPGIFEFKQTNRYVVGEGSIHPQGMVYTCTKDEPIAEIPDWLIADLQVIRSGRGLKVSAPIPADGEKYGEGEGRHPMLMSAAARLHDGTRDRVQLFDAVWALNIQKCDPPKTSAHVAEIIDWLLERPPVDRGPAVIVGKTQPPSEAETEDDEPRWGVTADEAILQLDELGEPTPYLVVQCKEGGDDQVVFTASSVNQIYAFRGLGKTNLALGLAACFATGGALLDFRALKVRVVYLDGELPIRQLYKRAELFGLTQDVLLISPENRAKRQSIDLTKPVHMRKLLRAIDHHIGGQGSDGVVILDSQATLMTGDALKSEFHERRRALLNELRWRGLCVIEMHHSGKNYEAQRGSSKNDDLLDVQIQLSPSAGWEPGMGLKFDWNYVKVRHNALYPENGFTVALQDGQWVKRISDEQLAVEDMLKEGKSLRKISRELELSLSKVQRLKGKIDKAGRRALNEKQKTEEKN